MIPLKDHSLLFADIKCTLECTTQNTLELLSQLAALTNSLDTQVLVLCMFSNRWVVGGEVGIGPGLVCSITRDVHCVLCSSVVIEMYCVAPA